MKNILVATDFSNEAYNALHFVGQLFKEQNCHFYLLNAYTEHAPLMSLKVGYEDSHSRTSQLSAESQEGLDKTFHRIHLDLENDRHQFTTISKNHELIESIQDSIQLLNIDLLVVGSKEKKRGGNLFQSRQLPTIVQEIDSCPVLVVPEEVETEEVSEIAFATDYKRTYDAKTLNPLLFMADLCESKVCVVHINEEEKLSKAQQSNRNTLKAYLRDIRHTLHWMPDFSSKCDVIKCFLQELNIGMLVMIRSHHAFLPSLFREAVIKKMSCQLKIPFLVLPEGNKYN